MDADQHETYRQFLIWRGVEEPCVVCKGSGIRLYGSTATWRGGIGGQRMTRDVCDACWGTGDEHRKGEDLRAMAAAQREWEHEQCMQYFALRTGATLRMTRRYMSAIADILDREKQRRTTPFDSEKDGSFLWRETLRMVSAALRCFGGEGAPRG